MNCFDLYIILKDSEWLATEKNLVFIKNNILCENKFIVSSKSIKAKIEEKGFLFLDENNVLEGLSINSVKELLLENGIEEKNAGWYLQQFIKYSISYISKNEYYLVWDADTIPLSPIDFFDKDGHPFFNLKREYFKYYFDFIESCLGIKKAIDESFISEHMIFNRNIVIEIMKKIERKSTEYSSSGKNFWKSVIKCNLKNKNVNQRFFSEFETYGTYIENYYPELYQKRKISTLRVGASFIGFDFDWNIVEWLSKDFDTISFEKWASPLQDSIRKIQNAEYREKISAANHIRKTAKRIKQKYILAVFTRNFKKVQKIQPIVGSFNFDFFFGDWVCYTKAKKSSKASLPYRIFRKVRNLFLGEI